MAAATSSRRVRACSPVAVDRDAGFDVAQVARHRLAGGAQLVDAVGEGIVGPNTAGDHVGPVMIETGAQGGDLASTPAIGLLEAIMGRLAHLAAAHTWLTAVAVAARACSAASRSSTSLACHRRRSARPWRLSPLSAPIASSRSRVPATIESLLDWRSRARASSWSARATAAERSGGWPVEDRPMGFDPGDQLALDDERVGVGGQPGIGLSGQSGGHLLGGAAPIGQHPAVVARGDGGGVPGVSGLAGPGLAAVAPVGVEGRAAQQVTALPGAALGAVNRASPSVRHVWAAIPSCCPARTAAGSTARPPWSTLTAKPCWSTRSTVAVVPLTRPSPRRPQRACRSTRSPARYSRSAAQPGPASAGPDSTPAAVRRRRIRSARSSASTWETANAATSSAP